MFILKTNEREMVTFGNGSYKMPNRTLNVQGSDTTEDESSNLPGYKKISFCYIVTIFQ